MTLDYGRVVDFHSHILPGVDHGSDSLVTTLYQLNSAKKHGISKIISTSHFYPTAHSVEGFLKKRNAAYTQLLERGGELPEIRLGAEVLLCNGIDRLEGIEKLCINGTNSLLLELPFSDFCYEYVRTVERLLHKGLDVILAHADRYDCKNIETLIPLGVRVQLNASSLIGFKKLKNKHLFEWMEKGLVVALGSDIHGKDSRAHARLCKAFKSVGTHAEKIISLQNDIWNNSTEF